MRIVYNLSWLSWGLIASWKFMINFWWGFLSENLNVFNWEGKIKNLSNFAEKLLKILENL